MKKTCAVLLAAATAATVLAGCAPHSPDLSMPTTNRADRTVERALPAPVDEESQPSAGFTLRKSILPGGFRKAFDPSGSYSVEYIHFSPLNKPDEMPSYSLELREDNTFAFHADVNGVVSEHYGNYYIKHGGALILYYDEPMETPAHNTFVADSMYMELLPQGKIMFYDDCGTIVLSKSREAAPIER